MCLGVPARIEEFVEGGTGICDVSGMRTRVDLSLVDSPAVGDYVLVHAGFAIQKIDEQEAMNTLELIGEMISEDTVEDE